MMDRCAEEFTGLDLALNLSEAYVNTPYPWEYYAILILPPNFPFGAMENPMLTFATPTIVVGDKSGVYVATHEICHSWTGNDVTCKNWIDLWLNEGYDTFLERMVS